MTQQAPPATDDSLSDALAGLNDSFHDSYSSVLAQARAALGSYGRPVILIMGDRATLLHDGQQETAVFVPPLYHRLKAISHVSFGLYVALTANGPGPLRPDVRAALRHKRDLLRTALNGLDDAAIPAAMRPLQRQTLHNALVLCEETIAADSVDIFAVLDFCAENADLYLENAALCAGMEMEELHALVGRWQEDLGPAVWHGVYVVICAAHQARYRHTARQYFMRLLGEHAGEGAAYEDRVVYAEHLRDMDAALDLLARHLVDQRASLEFFSSRTRLQADLMADGAAAALDRLFPSP